MNDPIRELWAQCVVKHTKTPMNWQDVADEFAELIVRECIIATGNCAGTGDMIKEHFGVEK